MRNRGSRQETGLTRYSLQVGRLVELHATNAALLASKQEAERETVRVKQAKLEIEAAHNTRRHEMA